MGKFSYEAERLPEVRACLGGAGITTVAVGPGFESYSARCTNGDALAVRCEFGNCRVLK